VILSVEFSGIGYLPDSLTELVSRARTDAERRTLPGPAQKRLSRELWIEAIYTTSMMAMFVVGEITALAAYQTAVDTLATRIVVWVALGCGAAACIFPILSEQYRDFWDRTHEQKIKDGIVSRPWLLQIEGVLVGVAVAAVLTAIGVIVVVPA
jgi:hypothetical protein